jgi:toxin HigB-1
LEFRFKTKKLEALYTSRKGAHKYPDGVICGFFTVMALITAAVNLRDLSAIRSRNFERLQGDREGQYSMRLNDQYRLILELEEDEQGKYLLIVEIVDYH